MAVGVGVHEQDHRVVEEPHRLFVGAAHHLVDHLAELLRAEHFAGVQPAVDPDHRLAVARERARLIVGQVLGQREPPRRVLDPREVLVILGRRDNRHQVRAALGGLADLLQDHPIRLAIELLPVGGELLIGRQLIVVAEVEAELFLRRGDARRLCRGRRHEDDEHQESKAKDRCHGRMITPLPGQSLMPGADQR